MTATLYPDGDLDVPAQLHRLAGGFWTEIYDGRDDVGVYAASVGEGAYDALMRLRETAQCLSRQAAPDYRREAWRYWPLSQTAGGRVLLRYGDGASYGEAYAYGVPGRGAPTWPAPDDLAECWVITNRLADPSVIWVQGIDYQIDA